MTPLPESDDQTCGWAGSMPVFQAASLDDVLAALDSFVRSATPEQVRAWRLSVPPLQEQCRRVLEQEIKAATYGAILEYPMPDCPKRADALLLIAGNVLVIELKGDGATDPEYLEQVADYARRLYWYHPLCGEEKVRVHSVVVSYGLSTGEARERFYTLTDIENLHAVVRRLDQPGRAEPIPIARFVAPHVCQPSPSLVQAVRRFFASHALPRIKRIDEITDGAVQRLVSEIHKAHLQRRRTLILLSGVPGAGKTYVGLRIAHERFLDDLAEPLSSGEKPTAPAVFLSGNAPLVQVLQYELRRAGGEGRVFVRGVKDFVDRYSKNKSLPPPHHVLIFDEAQRAWDESKVRVKHDDRFAVSEPAKFVQFAERVPGWCVVIALIGNGQEIHTGEEGGIHLWADAVPRTGGEWDVVGPDAFQPVFAGTNRQYVTAPELHLARSVRFHFAAGLSEWTAGIVEDNSPPGTLASLAADLKDQGYQLRITRDLTKAKEFLWAKYRRNPDARFGLLVSSRDKGLESLDIKPAHGNFFRAGPWYVDPESSPNSCRRFLEAATEFSAQGLELDHTIVVWGGDFVRKGESWDIAAAKRYRSNSGVRDPKQLRRNAYRVLLTRGREGLILCLPKSRLDLDETYEFLSAAGCEVLI